MCGRFALSAPVDAIRQHFKLREEVALPPRYNIAPTQQVAVVRADGSGNNELVMMRWGLVPFWAEDSRIGARLINARAETLDEKPSFKVPFRTKRCLIPADGFYEWQAIPGQKGKQPYFIRLRDGEIFAFAGLWSSWTDHVSGKVVESCTVITTEPNALVAKIHNRMPVILVPEEYGQWLDRHCKPEVLLKLCTPFDAARMESYPVSPLCNSPAHDLPDCLRPAPSPPA